MKSIEEIINTKPVFLNNWKSEEDVWSDFQETDNPHNILFASYGTGSYEGDSYVISTLDGKLYENIQSHCSCYGLEGLFDPEEIVLKELENRLTNGTFGECDYCNNGFKNELIEFLNINEIKYLEDD